MPTILYIIEYTKQAFFVDKNGNPMNGLEVHFYVPEFDRSYYINIDTRDKKKIDETIMSYIDDLRGIAGLGTVE